MPGPVAPRETLFLNYELTPKLHCGPFSCPQVWSQNHSPMLFAALESHVPFRRELDGPNSLVVSMPFGLVLGCGLWVHVIKRSNVSASEPTGLTPSGLVWKGHALGVSLFHFCLGLCTLFHCLRKSTVLRKKLVPNIHKNTLSWRAFLLPTGIQSFFNYKDAFFFLPSQRVMSPKQGIIKTKGKS